MAPSPAASPLKAAKARAARLEREGELAGALEAYQQALAMAPEDAALHADLADLAERMGLAEVAEGLWRRARSLAPDDLRAVDGHARALRELGRFDDAIGVLQAGLSAAPAEARLWNTLGVNLTQGGRADEALTFFDEALRLDPRLASAAYNRGSARFDLLDLDGAQLDLESARKAARRPADTAMIDFALATLALARGELSLGWEAYEARLSPHAPRPVIFDAPGRRWTPDAPLEGRRLLAIAEQGLGDEILFASLIPDLIEAVGPQGGLAVAADVRLVPLLARTFPQVEVVAHETVARGGRLRRSAPGLAQPRSIDLWAPLGALPRRFRARLEDFPPDPVPLCADPKRLAHWRAWLADGPPAVGLSWRSGKLGGDRRRHYPPLSAWRPILRTPGVRLVNLQYDWQTEEVAELEALAGQPLMQPPGLDLRNDIDDLAALCAALPRVISVNNATAQLAAAAGAPTVMICGPGAWITFGQDHYPWRPNARAVAPPTFGDWTRAMTAAAGALAAIG